MARGLDKEIIPVAPPKRNPFRQDIEDQESLQRKEEAAQRKKQEQAEGEYAREADVFKKETEELARQREREEFEQRFIRAHCLVEEYDPEKAQKEVDQYLDEQKEIEEEIKNYYLDRRNYLLSRGITDFTGDSPGYQALSNSLLYPEGYSIKIEAVKDPLLLSEGKKYIYSVKEGERFSGKIIEEGFSASRREAEVAAEAVRDEKVAASFQELESDIENWEKKKQKARAKQEERLEKLEALLKRRSEKEALLIAAGIDYKSLRLGNRLDVVRDGVPELIKDRVQNIQIDTLGDIDIVTYDRGRGNFAVALFRNKKLYAATLNRNREDRLIPIGVYHNQEIMTIPSYSNEVASEEEARRSRLKQRLKEAVADAGGEISLADKLAAKLSTKKQSELLERQAKLEQIKSRVREEESDLARAKAQERFKDEVVAKVRQYLERRALSSTH